MENKKDCKKCFKGIKVIVVILLTIAVLSLIISISYMIYVKLNSNKESNNQVQNNIVTSIPNDTIQENNKIGDNLSMKIKLNNKDYDVLLDSNKTTKEIISNLSLNLNMTKYAGHEYYSELPFKPTMDENTTSEIKAGHIYYWDGWNAFVINYIDYDITPYKVVHIGEIKDKTIVDVLANSEDEVKIEINE